MLPPSRIVSLYPFLPFCIARGRKKKVLQVWWKCNLTLWVILGLFKDFISLPEYEINLAGMFTRDTEQRRYNGTVKIEKARQRAMAVLRLSTNFSWDLTLCSMVNDLQSSKRSILRLLLQITAWEKPGSLLAEAFALRSWLLQPAREFRDEGRSDTIPSHENTPWNFLGNCRCILHFWGHLSLRASPVVLIYWILNITHSNDFSDGKQETVQKSHSTSVQYFYPSPFKHTNVCHTLLQMYQQQTHTSLKMKKTHTKKESCTSTGWQMPVCFPRRTAPIRCS